MAQAAIVKRDRGALQPLLHPYLHWVQADAQVVRGRTKVIGMLQAIGRSGPRRPSSCATARSTAGTSEGAPIPARGSHPNASGAISIRACSGTTAERPSATGAHSPWGCFEQEPRGHERPRR